MLGNYCNPCRGWYRQWLAVLLLAVPVTNSLAVASEPATEPVELLQNVSDKVISILKDKREQLDKDPDQVYELVNEHIVPHLDSVTMAKLALGKHWRNADRDQKIEFVNEFRTLLVRTYGKSLLEFRDQKINFFPLNREEGEERVVVKSEVLQSGGPSIPVAYRMRIKDNEWKVYDLSIDGVSLVTSYRGTFEQEVRKSGIDGLLQLLKDKNSNIKVES